MIETRKSNWKTQKIVEKPECIVHYNKNMGSVDKTDMQISFVECLRKTIKWYKKFFFHLLGFINIQRIYVIQNEA